MVTAFHPFSHRLIGAFSPFTFKVIIDKGCTPWHSVICFLVFLWSFSALDLISLHVFWWFCFVLCLASFLFVVSPMFWVCLFILFSICIYAYKLIVKLKRFLKVAHFLLSHLTFYVVDFIFYIFSCIPWLIVVTVDPFGLCTSVFRLHTGFLSSWSTAFCIKFLWFFSFTYFRIYLRKSLQYFFSSQFSGDKLLVFASLGNFLSIFHFCMIILLHRVFFL